MRHKAWLLLGSNEGQRETWLQEALAGISASCGTIVQQSHIYETAAWGKEDQPDFLNMAICVSTTLKPLALLNAVLQIEQQLGRQRELKWGQRTLDIDILFYDNLIVGLPELKIPHPYIQERRFALTPLNEIAPELVHPVFNKTISELLAECSDQLPARKL